MGILAIEMRSNYLRVNKIGGTPILAAMPGPWGKAIEALRLAQPGPPSKKAIAKRAKMTPTTYGNIEKGGHTHTRKLQHIADALRVPIELVLMPNQGTTPQISADELFERLAREAIEKQAAQRASVQQKIAEMNQFTEEEETARLKSQAASARKHRSGRKK